MNDNLTIQFRLSGEPAATLTSRAERSLDSPAIQAREDMQTLWALLRLELTAVTFTLDEAEALAEAWQGDPASTTALSIPGNASRLLAELRDGRALNHIAQHMNDQQFEALVARVASWGPALELGVREAIERWWAIHDDHETPLAAYRAAGLRVVDPGANGQQGVDA